MLLPKSILAYFNALLSASWKFSLVYLSHFSRTSHDSLTRALKRKYPWKKILFLFLSEYNLNNGYLIIDETDIDKSYSKVMIGASWIFSHRKNKSIFGFHLVVVCWTDGEITIPITWRLYQKKDGKTKPDLALEMIKFCTFTLGIDPHAWLFDSLYASFPILKFLVNHNLNFFTQVPKNRNFNGKQLKFWNKNRPYWQDIGFIKGKIKIRVVKNRKKYFITNVISIPRQTLLDTYKLRWKIEEVFRAVKQNFGFERCQCRNLQAQMNHFKSCFVLFVILQDIAKNTKLTVYEIKQKATFDHSYAKSLNLASYFEGA